MVRDYLKHFSLLLLIVLTLFAGACTNNENSPNNSITENEARQRAENFVSNSPTYNFDGNRASLELVETLFPDIENTWQFVFRFLSTHAGWGDRTGQPLLEVITWHEATITVQQGEVTNAVMDNKWDMVNQRMLEEETTMPTTQQNTTPSNHDLENLVNQAKEDLSNRLSISTGQIEVLEAKSVVWPDASIGCPQPDMQYKQVPVDGALIRFRAGGKDYEYHYGGNRGLFLCERPTGVQKDKPPQINLLPTDSADK